MILKKTGRQLPFLNIPSKKQEKLKNQLKN